MFCAGVRETWSSVMAAGQRFVGKDGRPGRRPGRSFLAELQRMRGFARYRQLAV